MINQARKVACAVTGGSWGRTGASNEISNADAVPDRDEGLIRSLEPLAGATSASRFDLQTVGSANSPEAVLHELPFSRRVIKGGCLVTYALLEIRVFDGNRSGNNPDVGEVDDEPRPGALDRIGHLLNGRHRHTEFREKFSGAGLRHGFAVTAMSTRELAAATVAVVIRPLSRQKLRTNPDHRCKNRHDWALTTFKLVARNQRLWDHQS